MEIFRENSENKLLYSIVSYLGVNFKNLRNKGKFEL